MPSTGPPGPAISRAADRPLITHGCASGDVRGDRAVLWARTDRPARMLIELAATEAFHHPRRLCGPDVLEAADFTGKFDVGRLPAGADVFYRLCFESLEVPGRRSEPIVGRLRTPPARDASLDRAGVRFAWSADTAGQGFGVDLSRGGMRTYDVLRRQTPDFFVHCGDTMYADNPIPSEIPLPEGGVWRNLVTEETSKVAETLAEFRARYQYNLLDEHVRRCHAELSTYFLWDDHETVNNWYPGEWLDDDRYTVKSVSLLAARARRAFMEYLPVREHPRAPGRIYRTAAWGPRLELFFLDMRSHRGPNPHAADPRRSRRTALLGAAQLAWLKRRLAASRATWKVVCADMPLGLIVEDGPGAFEAVANGDGPPRGREWEIAELLAHLQQQRVRNVVWLTADVHYAASHHYSPERAMFSQFDPFWEFVSGPLHAGTFGPNRLDNTFGPRVVFSAVPPGAPQNQPPTRGLQFFGMVEIDGPTGELTVRHLNVAGEELWRISLPAE